MKTVLSLSVMLILCFFKAAAAETKIAFEKGILDAAAENFRFVEKTVNMPEEGELEFDFKPDYGLEKIYPDRKVFTYYLFSARTNKGGFFAGINVIPEQKQTVIWLYAKNPGENGKVFGSQGNFFISKGQWCKIKVQWRAKTLSLSVNNKTVVKLDNKTRKGYSLELPDRIQIGGAKNAPAARGKFRNFIIRSLSPLVPTSIVSRPELKCLEICSENEDLLHLVAESPEKTSIATIRPGIFQVKRGQRYIVDFPNAVPYEVTAVKDGELTVKFPDRYRADMIISPARSGNLLPDGSFENSTLWPRASVSGIARTGKQSLKLTLQEFGKSVNTKSEPIPVEAGKKYRFSVFYRQKNTGNDTMFGTHIYIYKNGEPGGKFVATDYEYNNFPKDLNAETAWKYSHLEFTVPSDWKKHKITAKIIFSITGRPGTILFDDANLHLAPPSVSLAGKTVKIPPTMSETQLLAHMEKHPGYQAKIVKVNDTPAIEVNGRIVPPVPLCSWNSALAATGVERGVEIIMLNIPVNNWGVKKLSVWQGKDLFDFSLVDKALKNVLQYCPDAKVIVKIGGAYKDFGNDFPNSKWVKRNGKNVSFHNSGNVGPAFSLISEEVRQNCADAYRRIAEHIGKSPYGKAVIGCKITFGGDGQWYPAVPPWNFKHFDHSEGSRQSVINRLRMQYKNDLAALRKAWADDRITFETITLPDTKEFEITGTKLLDPTNPGHRKLLDIALAYHREVLKSAEIFCSAFKEGIKKDVITGIYYTSNSGLCHEELEKSDKIDFFATLGSYMRPRDLGGFSTAGLPLGSIRLHNKLFFEEMDYRNDYSNVTSFKYRKYLGVPLNASPDRSFAQLRRSFGAIMTQGHSGWFMTMGQRCHFTWYGPYAPIMQEVVDAFKTSPPPINNQWDGIVVFHEEKRPLYYTKHNSYDHNTNYLSSMYSADSGVAMQHYYLSDLTNPKRPAGSKLYIFATSVKFSEEQLQYIEKNLQKNGNILVFFNDAGALSDGGFEKNIRRLTGMNIWMRPDITVGSLISGEKNCDLTSSLPVYALYCTNIQSPLHFIDDPDATVLTRYLNTSHVAGAMKKHRNWTAVYFGGFPQMVMTGDLIRKLAIQAGIKPFAPAGDISAAGNGIMMLHARKDGEKTLQWQGKYDLRDLITGKIVIRKAEKFTFTMKSGETRWFKLQETTGERN